jgi:hypothetical protein
MTNDRSHALSLTASELPALESALKTEAQRLIALAFRREKAEDAEGAEEARGQRLVVERMLVDVERMRRIA